MAWSLEAERQVVQKFIGIDRTPVPVSLGFGRRDYRSVIEVLEFVEVRHPSPTTWTPTTEQEVLHPNWRTRPNGVRRVNAPMEVNLSG